MNRMEEYRALLRELEKTPTRLNFTVARAKARAKGHRLRRALGYPLSAAAVCVCFVLLVNLSGPFAAACSDIPILKDLARAVSFSPSLSAAVEHDWVQPMGLTQQDGELTMTVEYVIVDQKQLNIFYKLEQEGTPDPEAHYIPHSDLLNTRGEELACFIFGSSVHADGELHIITADFTSSQDSMPGQVRLECEMTHYNEETDQYDPVGQFAFDLTFDPQFTEQGRVVELNRWLELDGQRILLRDVEIYPTHMRFNLEDDPDNTAWLRGLEFYAEDEDGTRYDTPGNGVISVGSPDSPFTPSFRLDTSYFSEGERLTLCVTGAEWLDKEQEWTWVDLTTGETGFLPQGISMLGCAREGDEVRLTFRTEFGTPGSFVLRWRLPGGEAVSPTRWSSGSAYDPEAGKELEGYKDISFFLENCTGDRVELELDYTSKTEYDQPVRIPVF